MTSAFGPNRISQATVIGVTGNIASGKSTVMRQIGALGASLIDADCVYHELIVPGRPLANAIRDHFGDRVVAGDGSIDRRALGSIVFSDPQKLVELERITHPEVTKEIRSRLLAYQSGVVAVDAIKLIESGTAALCDIVWLVVCPRQQHIARLMARNNFDYEEAERRVNAQPSLESKRALADTIIDNGGTVEETNAQVIAAWNRLDLTAT